MHILVLFTLVASVMALSEYAGEGSLSLPKMTGGWYQLLTSRSFKDRYQASCTCPQVYYSTVNDTTIQGQQACLVTGSNGQVRGYNATLTQGSPLQYPSRFSGYGSGVVVLKTYRSEAGDYSHLLLGSDRDFWLLSRRPNLESGVLQDSLNIAGYHGFNTSSVYMDSQSNCQWLIAGTVGTSS